MTPRGSRRATWSAASPTQGAVFRAHGSTMKFCSGSFGSMRRAAAACAGPQTTKVSRARASGGRRDDGRGEERLVAGERQELLRPVLAGQRPEAGAGAARHDHRVDLHRHHAGVLQMPSSSQMIRAVAPQSTSPPSVEEVHVEVHPVRLPLLDPVHARAAGARRAGRGGSPPPPAAPRRRGTGYGTDATHGVKRKADWSTSVSESRPSTSACRGIEPDLLARLAQRRRERRPRPARSRPPGKLSCPAWRRMCVGRRVRRRCGSPSLLVERDEVRGAREPAGRQVLGRDPVHRGDPGRPRRERRPEPLGRLTARGPPAPRRARGRATAAPRRQGARPRG